MSSIVRRTLLGCLFLVAFQPVFAAFETSLSNVDIDGQGDSARVLTASFDVTVNYTLWNDAGCPGCISQIVVGIVGEDQQCVYNGIPGTAPGVSDSGTVSLTTPVTPGDYQVRWSRDLQFSCNDAIAAFPGSNSELLGTIEVPQSSSFAATVRNVDIDGQGTLAVVRPGADFDADLDYTIWNSAGCPSCIAQIVLGVDDEGQDCAYNGIPSQSPGNSAAATVTLTAPLGLDTYDVAYTTDLQFGCSDARDNFANREKTIVGQIKVGSPTAFETEVTADIDGQGPQATILADTFEVNFDYQLWNAASCPSCISQIAVGIDDTAVDCAYNGIPGVAPGTIGQSPVQFTTPATPGTYEIRAHRDLEFTCQDALDDYPTADSLVVGTFTVPEPSAGAANVRNVIIDGQGESALILGAQFAVDLDYTIRNSTACPSCIAQLVLGIDGTGEDCAYNGIPPTAPGTSGSSSVMFTTPGTPGSYELRWTRDLQFGCNDAVVNYTNRPLTTFGRIEVGDPGRFETVIQNVDIDGQGTRAQLGTTEEFEVSLDYTLWNANSCSGCISQIVIGLDNQPLACIYDSIPGTAPGSSGSTTVNLTPLPTGGRQELNWTRDLQFSCADAIENYRNRPKTMIGEVLTGAPVPGVFDNGFEE